MALVIKSALTILLLVLGQLAELLIQRNALDIQLHSIRAAKKTKKTTVKVKTKGELLNTESNKNVLA